MYAPNSSRPFSPGHGVDFWSAGLLITGIASLTGVSLWDVPIDAANADLHDSDGRVRAAGAP